MLFKFRVNRGPARRASILTSIARRTGHELRTLTLVSAIGAMVVAVPAHADPYPNRPVKIVVPFSAGTTSDVGARRLAQGMEKILKQPFVVENVGGSGGINGTQRVANAEPDGYTLLVGTIGTHGINLGVYRSLPYDPLRSFEPISRFISYPNILVVNPSLEARTLSDLIRLARERSAAGRPLNYASGGAGTSSHIGGEQLKQVVGAELVHVPYRGVAAAVPDLLSGRIDMLLGSPSVVSEFVKAGSLRALANSGSSRSALLPEVATVSELGFPQLELSGWNGLFAPAGTNPEFTERLRATVHTVLNQPDVQAAFAHEGTDIVHDTNAAEFTQFIESEIGKWVSVTKTAGITAQ
jgi:tripartite-type tricarboxylate transporter receptor subunit TctC